MGNQSALSRWVDLLGGTCVLAALLVTVAPAQAQVEELPPAATILDRHVEVTGGKKAHLHLTTRKTTGKLAVDMAGHKFDAKIEIHAQAPGSSHMLVDSEFISQVSACNGEDAWVWSRGHGPDSGTTRLLAGPEKAAAIDRARWHGNVHWRKRFAKVETVGIARVGDKPAYEVRVATKSGTRHLRFYDVVSGRLVKYTRATISREGEIATEVFPSAYREFDGVWLPTKVHTVLSSPAFGKGTQTWTYTKIEHGVKTASALFKMPAELANRATKKSADKPAKKARTHPTAKPPAKDKGVRRDG